MKWTVWRRSYRLLPGCVENGVSDKLRRTPSQQHRGSGKKERFPSHVEVVYACNQPFRPCNTNLDNRPFRSFLRLSIERREIQSEPMIRNYPRPNHPMQSDFLFSFPDGVRVKRRVPRMRACDEKNDKGKLCAGHLKRLYGADEKLLKRLGGEIYRCERCATLYIPNLEEKPRTETLTW